MNENKKKSAEELNLLADIKHPRVDTSKPLPYYLRRRMKEYSILAEINEFGTYKSSTRSNKEHITDLISGKCIDSVSKLIENEKDAKDLKIKSLILASKYILSELIGGKLDTVDDIEGAIGYENLIKIANYLMFRRADIFYVMATTLLDKYDSSKIFVDVKGESLLGLCLQSVTSNFANREATEKYYTNSETIRNFINKLSISEKMNVRGLNFVAQSVASFSNLVGTDRAYTRSVCAAIDIMKNPRLNDWSEDPYITPFIELSRLFVWSHAGMSDAEIEEDANYVREHVGMMCEDPADIFPEAIVESLEAGDPNFASIYTECGTKDSTYYLVPKSIFDRFPKFIIAAWDNLGQEDMDVYYRAVANLTLKAESLKEVTDFFNSLGKNLLDVIDDCVDGFDFKTDENNDLKRTPAMYIVMNIMRLLKISDVPEEFRNHCRDRFVSIYTRKLTIDNPFFVAVSLGEPAFHAVHYTNDQMRKIIEWIGYNRATNLLSYDNYDVIVEHHDAGEWIPFSLLYDTSDVNMEVLDKIFNIATSDERRSAPFPIEYMKKKGSEEFDAYITSENVDRYIQAYGLDHVEELTAIPIMKVLLYSAPSAIELMDRYLDIIMNDAPARNLILGKPNVLDHIRNTDTLPEIMRAKEVNDDAKAELLYTLIVTDEKNDMTVKEITYFVNMLDPNNKYAGLCLALAARKADTDEDKATVDSCIANINRG